MVIDEMEMDGEDSGALGPLPGAGGEHVAVAGALVARRPTPRGHAVALLAAQPARPQAPAPRPPPHRTRTCSRRTLQQTPICRQRHHARIANSQIDRLPEAASQGCGHEAAATTTRRRSISSAARRVFIVRLRTHSRNTHLRPALSSIDLLFSPCKPRWLKSWKGSKANMQCSSGPEEY